MWNYLKENTWRNKHDLTLYDMVSDIFDIDTYGVLRYVWKRL